MVKEEVNGTSGQWREGIWKFEVSLGGHLEMLAWFLK